jgi:3-isopropylmalate dehydrogenase
MGTYRLGVLRGDGIGPEIVEATLRVLEAVQQRDRRLVFEWVPLPIGWEAIRRAGCAMPESTVEALEQCDAWIMGPHDSASYPAAEREKRNPSGELRHRFDLYANIRPARAYPGLPAVSPRMDLVVVRENTEGFYADRNMAWGVGELMPTPDLVLTVGIFTRHGSERIARTAFSLARQRRCKVAIVHKANVVRKGYGLFLETCRRMAKEFPDVAVEDYHIDAMAAHGSAPDIAGKGIGNPVGIILSAAMLLAWLAGQRQDDAVRGAGQAIERAVAATLAGGPRTPDLGGTAGTSEFTAAILRHLAG